MNESTSQGHETSDAVFKKVFMTGIGLLGIMVLGLLLSWGVYAFFRWRSAEPGAHAETLTRPDPAKLPPGPLLEADPHAALVALRRTEDSVLGSYGWVNKDSGIVRIPVERAMQLMLEKKMLQQQQAGGK